MFQRRLRIEVVNEVGGAVACPLKWIDNFAMRNFTNDAAFDDTLPLEDGLMEVGNRVPIEAMRAAMEDWFGRKGWLKAGEEVRLRVE
jgi:hypothetical protein